MRRVVTGVDRQGKAVFTRDDDSPHKIQAGGFEMGETWFDPELRISDGLADAAADKVGSVPSPGQALMRYVVFPPRAEMEAMMGQTESLEVDGEFQLEAERPDMHTTETIDYGFVLDGEICLELDDGAEKILRTGDCFVQNGTRHAWRNRSDSPAVIGVVMLGAERQD